MQINYQMKIAICDDDEKDRALLMRLLSEYVDLHDYHIRLDEFPSGEGFLKGNLREYSLVFLDIYMGSLNGIETARELIRQYPEVRIIFCSSSNEFAAESYDLAAMRYLIKPVQRDKLFQTLDRFFSVHTSLRKLTVKQNRMDESILHSDILWVEADGHRSIIHTKFGDITTRTPFSQICEELRTADFVKPIRYALVSLQAVAAIPSDVFTLTDGTTVPISRDLRPDMKRTFSDYKMKKLLQRGGDL